MKAARAVALAILLLTFAALATWLAAFVAFAPLAAAQLSGASPRFGIGASPQSGGVGASSRFGIGTPTPDGVVAIKAGKVVDPETGKAAANQIILVEGRRIKEIGPNVAIPSGAKVVDLSRATVLPGLFDAHTHLCMTVIPKRDAGNYYFTTLLDTTAYRAIEGVANGQAMLQSGFTTVRDVGNAGNYADTALREGIEHGWVQGPTIINAGIIISVYGGQFHLQPEKKDLATPEYLFADTRDEMRKAVRQNIHFGAKVIKIVVDDQDYIYSADDIRFLREEAHATGLKLVGGRLLPGPAGPASFLMYESASGERFTVYTAKAETEATQMRYTKQDSNGALFWADRGVGYVVSGGSDRERLMQVARIVYDQAEKNGS